MDFRILLGIAFGLIAVAFGGFYFAFGSRTHDTLATQPPAKTAAADPSPGAAPAGGTSSPAPAGSQPAPQASPPVRPSKATPESVEAEIAQSDHAELQALLKKYFADDYKQMIATAVERRNEGVSDPVFAQELFGRFQDLMRAKLRYAAGASIPMMEQRSLERRVSYAAVIERVPMFVPLPPKGIRAVDDSQPAK